MQAKPEYNLISYELSLGRETTTAIRSWFRFDFDSHVAPELLEWSHYLKQLFKKKLCNSYLF